jgi:hypothetical protein
LLNRRFIKLLPRSFDRKTSVCFNRYSPFDWVSTLFHWYMDCLFIDLRGQRVCSHFMAIQRVLRKFTATNWSQRRFIAGNCPTLNCLSCDLLHQRIHSCKWFAVNYFCVEIPCGELPVNQFKRISHMTTGNVHQLFNLFLLKKMCLFYKIFR